MHESAPATTTENPAKLVAATPDSAGPNMSQAKARARCITAVAAQEFAEEQMRLVSGARIVDSGAGEVDAEWAQGGLSALDQQRLIEGTRRQFDHGSSK